MNASPAIKWLNTDFEEGLQRYLRKLCPVPHNQEWRGPLAVRPMIQLRSLLDRCASMRVTQADYHDPQRR